VIALWLGAALALDPGVGVEPLGEVPAAEQVDHLTQHISKKLRCPVCQGLSVADSSADAAVAMKARIQELVEQGYTEAQIVDYFIDRYGEWVLLEPKVDTNLVVWVLPVVALVVGLGVLFGRKREEAPPEPALRPGHELADDPYAARVLAELED